MFLHLNAEDSMENILLKLCLCYSGWCKIQSQIEIEEAARSDYMMRVISRNFHSQNLKSKQKEKQSCENPSSDIININSDFLNLIPTKPVLIFHN